MSGDDEFEERKPPMPDPHFCPELPLNERQALWLGLDGLCWWEDEDLHEKRRVLARETRFEWA